MNLEYEDQFVILINGKAMHPSGDDMPYLFDDEQEAREAIFNLYGDSIGIKIENAHKYLLEKGEIPF